MSKQGEIDYLKNIGTSGKTHAFDKPFSDINCGLYLSDLGSIMELMPPPPAKVLDLGMGTGWTSVFFSKRGYDVVGQDIAEDMVDLARKNKDRYNLSNIDFITSDYEDINFYNEFDVAIFYDSLHHALDEVKAIKSAFNALKPGGMLIAVEPGTGHANSKISLAAMTNYGVTEKDMPPSLIVSIGKQIGFQSYEIYKRKLGPERLNTDISIFLFFRIARRIIKTLIYNMRVSNIMKMSNIVVLQK